MNCQIENMPNISKKQKAELEKEASVNKCVISIISNNYTLSTLFDNSRFHSALSHAKHKAKPDPILKIPSR